MSKFLTIATAAATMMALPAAAQTYDAFGSFNGTQGSGNFFYGDTFASTGFTPYAVSTNCFIDGAVCLQRSANHDVPGVEKGGSPAFQYNSVNVPTDRLLVHPANDPSLVSALFQAPISGDYRVTTTFSVQDVSPTGVNLYLLTRTGDQSAINQALIGALSGGAPSFTYTTTLHLDALDLYGFGVGNGGNYSNDSTGLNFSVAAVPEPATWAMMLLGFGMVGFGLRYRRRDQAARLNLG